MLVFWTGERVYEVEIEFQDGREKKWAEGMKFLAHR